MLPSAARLRGRGAVPGVVRSARRLTSPTLVGHFSGSAPAGSDPATPARVGLIVPRAVGDAVVRNRVRRQLRHLVRDRLDRLPAGSRLVLRVLPPSAGRRSAELGADLDRVLDAALRPAPARPAAGQRAAGPR